MRIIVLDSLLKQAHGNTIPTEVLPRIFSEFQRLAELERAGRNTVEAYLKNHHGIRMKGTEKIYKYELTGGDRILYAHSSDIPWMREEGSYVLLRFSKHDVQGSTAKKIDLAKERGYAYIRDIVEKMDELEIDAVNNSDITMDDYVALAEILNSEDYTVWHKAYVIESEKKYASLSLEDMEVYLSDEQDHCIESFFKNPSPTLIIGGAGTGKTLIAVHLLHDYIKTSVKERACYFTQSPELRSKVQSLYRQISEDGESGEAEFQDINDFCLRQCGLKHGDMVYTNDFLRFIDNAPEISTECLQNGLSPIIIWTEIRGIIKGGMSETWNHNHAISQDDFPSPVQSLVKRGFLRRDGQNKKLIWLAENVKTTRERFNHEIDLSSGDKENILFALERFSRFDPTMRMMNERDYLNVSNERSSVEVEKRSFVWSVCQKYDEYLLQNKKYDENDLVRLMFERDIPAVPMFGLTIIDEVQDYTELQIFLIRKLTKENKIVFAGDEHQNINPASFSESRLKSLFYGEEDSVLRVVRLHTNYRCPQEIIDRTNALATVRQQVIGKGSAENESSEVSMRREEALPLRYISDNSGAMELILTLFRLPRAVILVANQSIKEEVLNRIVQQGAQFETRMGQEKFRARLASAVFTVAEIKGVEYEYVLCYDLMGANQVAWNHIIEDNVRKETKYRFYFNLLYVAMTRAQRFLCFWDSCVFKELEKHLHLIAVDALDTEVLYLNRLSDSDSVWFEQALELEKAGKYREALENYRAAKASPKDTYRCQHFIAREDGVYDEAVVMAILLDSSESVEMISSLLEDIESTELERLARIYSVLKGSPMDYDQKRVNISNLIASCIPEEKKRSDVERVFLQLLRDSVGAYVKTIHDIVV